MTVQSVQLNMNTQTDATQNKPVKSYRAAYMPIKTNKKTKPLPPQGHLVDDTFAERTKYFFKDIGYDMKSIKNGYTGTANDHQLGRLNDVGLRLGGIGIATYLASQTTNPKVRLMEYIGLAMFLTSMSVYPKVAINAPARLIHGYDIGKEYIDDQGRKKSVFQDSNYIPYDMYLGGNNGENLDLIGDRMGIPRDIKNRHEVIREQMRKIATQNNTLWMLTAGLATPLMTALLCSGIEKFLIGPGLEKTRNINYNRQIQDMLKKLSVYDTEIAGVNNRYGDSVKHILSAYEGKSLPREEAEQIIKLLTSETDSILSTGIKADIEKIIFSSKSVKIDSKILSSMLDKAEKSMTGRQIKYIKDNILPPKSEIERMIAEIKPSSDLAKGIDFSYDEFLSLKEKIFNYSNNKINSLSETALKHKDYINSNVIKYKNAFETDTLSVITNESCEKLVRLANIVGDFKNKSAILDKCINFKFEHAPESILANYYDKFQKTLIKELGISPKDYKRISCDKEFALKIIDEKFAELCKNERQYKQIFEKLGKILSDMELVLHGSAENNSQIKDLINSVELLYDKTAKILSENHLAENTADCLIKGDYGNTIKSKEELFKILDGIKENKYVYAKSDDVNALKYFGKGKGSSKNLKISRLINRYQGETNSFFRVFHSLDFYKRAIKQEELLNIASVKDLEYVSKLENSIKEMLLKGSISDAVLKFGIENKYEYRDFYDIGWTDELTKGTKEALQKNNKFNLSERLQRYITRFKNIMANNTTDFTRPGHVLDENAVRNYVDTATSNEAKFNLMAQNPVDMIQKGAGKMHADRMWLKNIGILTGAVFVVAFLAQFGFGKIKNKQNLQKINTVNNDKKQVKDESNK